MARGKSALRPLVYVSTSPGCFNGDTFARAASYGGKADLSAPTNPSPFSRRPSPSALLRSSFFLVPRSFFLLLSRSSLRVSSSPFLVAGCRLSVVGCRLSVVGCRLPVVGSPFPVVRSSSLVPRSSFSAITSRTYAQRPAFSVFLRRGSPSTSRPV